MHENVKSKPPTVQKVFNMNHEHKKHIIISFIMFAVITTAAMAALASKTVCVSFSLNSFWN